MANVAFKPEGIQDVIPYLIMEDVDLFLSFTTTVFGAVTREMHHDREGRVMHAETRIGDSVLMMGAAMEGYPPRSTMLYHYTADVDALFDRAIAANGKLVKAPEDMFYGDRVGCFEDPCGNSWWVATHVKDVSAEELAAAMANMGK